ncbi:MAG: peptidyl-prolyl cis-trans isomerase [Burkholderiales bacterium]|nr:peptidyl-prolyl cis-trans isomerase [Burkholderiales bacterium]
MKRLLLALWAITFCISAQAANPKVELQTNKGTITIELFPDKTPATVENFLRYVNNGFYNGTIFHRVIAGFMIQGGGYTQTYQKKKTGVAVENEAENGLRNEIGTVAMARTNDPHSATSQFFINVVDNAFLNFRSPTARGYGYAVFGKVIRGMDVVNAIAKAPTGAAGPFRQDIPVEMVTILQAQQIGKTQ